MFLKQSSFLVGILNNRKRLHPLTSKGGAFVLKLGLVINKETSFVYQDKRGFLFCDLFLILSKMDHVAKPVANSRFLL